MGNGPEQTPPGRMVNPDFCFGSQVIWNTRNPSLRLLPGPDRSRRCRRGKRTDEDSRRLCHPDGSRTRRPGTKALPVPVPLEHISRRSRKIGRYWNTLRPRALSESFLDDGFICARDPDSSAFNPMQLISTRYRTGLRCFSSGCL